MLLTEPLARSRPGALAPRPFQDARQEAGASWITRNRFGEQGAKPSTRQRTVVVGPGDRWQVRYVGCVRHHSRKAHYYARKPFDEDLVHSAVQPGVDRGGRHVVFN